MSAYTCTPEQLAEAKVSGFYCLSRSESLGLLIVGVAGLASLVAVLWLFLAIAWNAVRRLRQPRQLIQKPIEILLLSLFFADLLQGFGASLEIGFISSGIVKTGSLCTAQGALQNLGQAAIAMTTLAITLYTVIHFWWPNVPMGSLKTAASVVGLIWLYLVLSIVISVSIHKDPSYYAPSPYWCWISTHYPWYRLVFENGWLWLALCGSLLYIPLIFMIQGYIVPSADTWWKFSVKSSDERTLSAIRGSLYIAISALAYCIPVLPTSMSRWFYSAVGNKLFASMAGQFSINAIFSLSGIADVFVFRLTRQGLLGFDSPSTAPRASELNPIQTGEAWPGLDSENGTPMLVRRTPHTGIGIKRSNGIQVTAGRAQGNGNPEPGLSSHETQNPPSSATPGPFQTNEALTVNDTGVEATSQHYSRMFPRWRIILFFGLWLGINAADSVWIYYFVEKAIDPNPANAVNHSDDGWVAYYTMMWVFGFFLGAFNLVICGAIFVTSYRWFKDIRTSGGDGQSRGRRIISSASFRVLWWAAYVLILFPAAIILSFGPFFGPAVIAKPAQRYVWNTRCNNYIAEAILYGRHYNAPPGAVARASFYFWRNGVRAALYDYNITTSEADANLRYLQFMGAEPGVTIPASLYPTVQNVSLKLSDNTFTAYCTTGAGVPINMTSPCIFGSFDTTSYLTIITNDTRTDTGPTELRAIDPFWMYADSSGAPNYILKDVLGNTPGTYATRTAVLDPDTCAVLKTCLSREPGGDLLTAIGLTLIQQDLFANSCTAPEVAY